MKCSHKKRASNPWKLFLTCQSLLHTNEAEVSKYLFPMVLKAIDNIFISS